MKKTCIFCEHFRVETGDPGYSELTPGYSWSMSCCKGKWSFDPDRDGLKEYRKILTTAEKCDSFKEAEDQTL